jgi:hypothetical protein
VASGLHRSILASCAVAAIVASTLTASSVRGASGGQDLRAAFARAVEAIRQRQKPDGRWTTDVTTDPVYRAPVIETNIFTPAVIIDLLSPVEREAGLGPEVARARTYLRRQIEPSGLVRYHGVSRPADAAGRGCELPPDADDTALVWRIAPLSDKSRLAAALREIGRYRDSDGLYRTWLAGEDTYRCFYERYAGKEWNPPDVAVEMHIYLFLVEHDRAAADRLCAALKRRVDDDRIWVWYTVAPFLPLLRELDMSRNGCAVQIPDGRLARAVAGQQRYLDQARLLRDLLLAGRAESGERARLERYLVALREGAAGEFAGVREEPPLLYHNDLGAVPPHYHWSADVGYALWVRLYVEAGRRFPGEISLPRRPPMSAPRP